ncbi:hypothetical protein ACVIGB_001133 [Bradyrhizobium sp. USDA 4341]
MKRQSQPKDEYESGIRDVLGIITAGLDAEDKQAYQAARSSPTVSTARAALEAMDLTAFRWALQRPYERVVDGLLEEAFPGSLEARYLVRRASYVERHFRSIVQAHEGLACCADKARTILAALMSYFVEGKPIAFDRSGKYTFHLSTKVFLDQDSIIAFFEAVRGLDYGDPRAYIARPEITGLAGQDGAVGS